MIMTPPEAAPLREDENVFLRRLLEKTGSTHYRNVHERMSDIEALVRYRLAIPDKAYIGSAKEYAELHHDTGSVAWCAAYDAYKAGSSACHRLAHTARPDAGDELERGKAEIQTLIESIWRAEFRNDAPNWKPLDDLPGMISQMDNMYAGVRQQRDQARWDLHNRPDAGDEVEDETKRDAWSDFESEHLQSPNGESWRDAAICRAARAAFDEAYAGGATVAVRAAIAAMREGVDRGMVERAKEALEWAMAEIEGRTIYRDNAVWTAADQRQNALGDAYAALAALSRKGG